MTSVIEKVVGIIAPHSCIVCSINDNILCMPCAYNLVLENSFCALCGSPAHDWQVCLSCRHTTPLRRIWIGAAYEGAMERIVHKFKFERVRAAYKPLSQLVHATLPYLPPDWLVVPVPTASARIRQRGYDQTFLLAREVAKQRQLVLAKALGRRNNARQVGASRAERQRQAAKMFYVAKPAAVKGRSILLLDDVCTTGATLNATARLLKQAGASQVSAVVVAWRAPKG